MRQTVVPGVWSWSQWQPDRGLDFNSFFVEHAEGNLVVDPLDPDAETLADLIARGVAAVLVTNRDHERAAASVAQATGAQLIASELDAPLLAHPADRTVKHRDTLFGWTVLGFDGLKTPGEIALVDPVRRAAIVGDSLWGKPAGALTLMPKVADPAVATLSLRTLRAWPIDHLLVGDGACIFGGAYAAIGSALDQRDGLLTNRINLFDEVPYFSSPADPAPFTGGWADIGRRLGAERLGYAATRLAKGDVFCPYHWHTQEEELFVVLSGTPTLRTPRGTFVLRPGDCVAFRTQADGAHKLWNEADEDALVLLIANSDPGDVCYYPDSSKFVVESTGTLVRDHPMLDYFEGELPA